MPDKPDPYARSRKRNEQIRSRLTPLAPDERPWPLVVATLVAAALALTNLGFYLAGAEIDGERPAPGGIIFFCGLMLLAAWGMWTKRYWAVLGFQALLALIVVVFFLFLLRASTLLDVVISLGIAVPAGFLFWKLIRVLARLQTPAPPEQGDE
jgi:hypothetical protein